MLLEGDFMANQTDEETLKLIINLWSEDTIQATLEGRRGNKHVSLKIATEMEQVGCSKSAEQCASKIKT